MTYAKYSVGPPRRPNIRHDNGFLDKFQRRGPTLGERASYAWWRTKLEGGEAGAPGAPDLPDGYATYRHFMTGRGAARTFSHQRYVSTDASGKTTLKSAILEAMKAAYDLHRKQVPVGSGKFSFTGSAITCSETNPAFPYPATENWQKAIVGHSIWISGDVVVTRSKPSAKPQFALTLVIHAEDRYNFNLGAKDIATGIPDSANGVFEVTGLATQYMQYATYAVRNADSAHRVAGAPHKMRLGVRVHLVSSSAVRQQPARAEPSMARLARVVIISGLVMMGVVGCSGSSDMVNETRTDKADIFGGTQTDVATLSKFVTLQPAPVDAKWSVTTIGTGTDAIPGPSDTALWAVVRYSDADFAMVLRALKADERLRPVMLRTAPVWLLAEVDAARFQPGSDRVIDGPVSEGAAFASDVYSTGFAMPLSDRRVLIHFSSQ